MNMTTYVHNHKGLYKVKIIPKKLDNYGSGWVGPVLTMNNFFGLENCPKIVIYQYRYLGVVYHVRFV